MKFRVAVLIALAALVAAAERQPLERYQSIIDRQMFGELPDDFDPSKLPFKLTVLSVAPLIGEAIKRIHGNESVNDLFNHE